jgi:archaellum component FlaG (FlaF/FlaG flagellin family)
MKNKVLWLLLILILVIFAILGVEAVFVERKALTIQASAAEVKLQVSKPEVDSPPPPDGITGNSELTTSVLVRNTGTVSVYLHTGDMKLYVNGTPVLDSNRVRIEESGEEFLKPLGPGESRILHYRITFPGAETMREGAFALKGIVEMEAYTDQNRRYGFYSGPYEAVLCDYTAGDGLEIPVRVRNISLKAVYDPGSEPGTVVWFQGEQGDISGAGESMSWNEMTEKETENIEIRRDHPKLYRYEVRTPSLTARSDLYRIFLSKGQIMVERYDYFTGEKISEAVNDNNPV